MNQSDYSERKDFTKYKHKIMTPLVEVSSKKEMYHHMRDEKYIVGLLFKMREKSKHESATINLINVLAKDEDRKITFDKKTTVSMIVALTLNCEHCKTRVIEDDEIIRLDKEMDVEVKCKFDLAEDWGFTHNVFLTTGLLHVLKTESQIQDSVKEIDQIMTYKIAPDEDTQNIRITVHRVNLVDDGKVNVAVMESKDDSSSK